jgi:UDP-N-acetylglucosamine--N-acetylmuramyl-(pentapeptide) pyrophosphoryl-undecaprenol N-acetylglucosamine transferase
VPLVFAAWVCRIPVLVHQQDVRPGLANRLCAPFATVVTVVFEASKKHYGKKAVLTGNPVTLPKLGDKQIILDKFSLKPGFPLLLILGGGTGSKAINELLVNSLAKLLENFQIVHVVGAGKSVSITDSRYHQFESMSHDDLLGIMDLADLVVSRCGLGVLSEISLLAKAAILIPMPDSHQEDNAAAFAGSALVLSQKDLSGEIFSQEIIGLWQDKKRLEAFKSNSSKLIIQGVEAVSDVLKKIINHSI